MEHLFIKGLPSIRIGDIVWEVGVSLLKANVIPVRRISYNPTESRVYELQFLDDGTFTYSRDLDSDTATLVLSRLVNNYISDLKLIKRGWFAVYRAQGSLKFHLGDNYEASISKYVEDLANPDYIIYFNAMESIIPCVAEYKTLHSWIGFNPTITSKRALMPRHLIKGVDAILIAGKPSIIYPWLCQ
jgi:hypothetical protein